MESIKLPGGPNRVMSSTYIAIKNVCEYTRTQGSKVETEKP